VHLPPRTQRVRVVGSNAAVVLRPRKAGPQRHRLEVGPHGWTGAASGTFVPGVNRLTIRNATAAAVAVAVEDEAWTDTAATALLVTTMQDFRDLFSSEVLSPHHRVGVRNIALLFSDLKGSTAMYNAIGDAPAFGLVSGHLVFLADQVRRHGGAVVKTIGDAIMAAFPSRARAVEAALAMQRELPAFNHRRTSGPPLVLKLGVHEGPAIAVNANEVLDYFGTTVNLAARIQNESEGGDIIVPAAFLEDPGIRARLKGQGVAARRVSRRLKGFDRPFRLGRLTARGWVR
jgi:class 3 adenylate cyclase